MTAEGIVEALKRRIPDLSVEVAPALDQPTLVLTREQIVAACMALREVPALQFMCLSDVTAVDWWPGEPRFQVVYHLASIEHRLRLRLKVSLPGEDAHIPTVTTVWPGANWLEREVFDLFGIVFDGHPDLRRVLMPEDWEGYPLRKDYPVQIKEPVKVYEPLQITPEEFRKKIEDDRQARRHEADHEKADVAEQTKLTRK
jgi:NADH-quinone oxidoreductase subunit C